MVERYLSPTNIFLPAAHQTHSPSVVADTRQVCWSHCNRNRGIFITSCNNHLLILYKYMWHESRFINIKDYCLKYSTWHKINNNNNNNITCCKSSDSYISEINDSKTSMLGFQFIENFIF